MKLQEIEPASSADYLCTAEGLPETYFSTFSGIVRSFERAKFYDGYAARQRTAATGSETIDDATFTKEFDPVKDVVLIDWIETLKSGKYVNFTVRPVKRGDDVEFIGTKSWKLSLCRLLKATYPNADVSAPTDVSMIELTFSVDVASYG
jgi:hypothetical protein